MSDTLRINLQKLYENDDTEILGTVDSLSTFLKLVDSFGLETETPYGYYYRGQKDATWKICSSLTRAITPNKNDYIEKLKKNDIDFQYLQEGIDIKKANIYKSYLQFKNHLPGHISEVESKEFLLNSDISTLLLAQHYGMPTRFIDLTSNPLIALYFSVCEARGDNDCEAAVFIYESEMNLTGDEFEFATKDILSNPLEAEMARYNFVETAKASSFRYHYMSLREYENISMNLCINHYPFDKRMKSQECLFLFHNNYETAFTTRNRDVLKKIIIKNVFDIQRELMRIGFVESKIYPSLSGLTKSLLQRHVYSDASFFK